MTAVLDAQIDAARAALRARGVKLSRPHITAALEAAGAAAAPPPAEEGREGSR